jgi:hypothetical protein
MVTCLSLLRSFVTSPHDSEPFLLVNMLDDDSAILQHLVCMFKESIKLQAVTRRKNVALVRKVEFQLAFQDPTDLEVVPVSIGIGTLGALGGVRIKAL